MGKGVVGNWLETKYLDWQKSVGKRQTMAAFADYLGVSKTALNKWSNGERVPTGESVAMLASKLGIEIYDLVGIPRPDPMLQLVIENWGRLPDDVRREIAEAVERAEARGATGDSGSGVAPAKHRREDSN